MYRYNGLVFQSLISLSPPFCHYSLSRARLCVNWALAAAVMYTMDTSVLYAQRIVVGTGDTAGTFFYSHEALVCETC